MRKNINFQARSIAKMFLIQAADMGISLNGFKLIKLIYLAHRAMLEYFDRPLISSESFALWKYGPTLESLHIDLKSFEGRAIDVNSVEISSWRADRSDQCAASIVRVVLERFGTMPAMELSDVVHKSDLLWRDALKKKSNMALIDVN